MCLAVPGKVVELVEGPVPAAGPLGRVDFQGSSVEVSLALTPEAKVGDWVLVHAGYAISQLDVEEARQTWQYLEEADLGTAPEELRRAEDA